MSHKYKSVETEMITRFHDNGKVKANESVVKISLKDKKGRYVRHGISKWWYDNGQLEDVIEYKQNPDNPEREIRWTVHESYYRDGRPRDRGTLKNGTGSFITYDNVGNKSVFHYVNGVFQKK